MAVRCRKRYSTLLVDLDGVVWRGLSPIRSNVEGLRILASEARLVFLTNNSSRSRRLYSRLLSKIMGFHVPVTSVITSGYATALWLREKLGREAHVYPIGGPGLVEELAAQGHIPVAEEEVESCMVDAVVVGFTRSFNHVAARYAVYAINECNALFVATNDDRLLPGRYGGEPGAGAIVAYLREATGREPIVVGKPNPYIASLVEKLEPRSTLVVGDKVETDAELARRIGADALVVRDGVSSVSRESWYLVAASVADFASLDRCEAS